MNSPIPLFNLKRQHSILKKELFAELEKTYDAGEFTYGQATPVFEKNFADLCHVQYGLAVRSGTASLIIALKALELQAGDEIITTPVSFSASSDSIVLAGGIPVFVDVEPHTGNIDPQKLHSALAQRGKKVKAVLIVHLYGIPCEMDEIVAMCKKNKVLLIEDCSHAHGSLYKKKPVGSFGIAGCFSLYPSKTLGAIGNAGIISTNDRDFYQKMRMYANHGIKDPRDKYTHFVNGFNELIDNLQSVALNVKFQCLPQWIQRKREIALKYTQTLKESGVTGMVVPEYVKPSLYLYSFQTQKRDELQQFLKSKKIDSGVYYPMPLHLQPNFQSRQHAEGDFPVAEKFISQTLSIPLYPQLTDEEVSHICNALRQFFS